MEITLDSRDPVVIVRMVGKLAAGVGDRQLRALVDKLLSESRRRILLDLSQVSGIDSSGVGELVASLRVVRELGGELRILKATDSVHRILDLTQVLPLFEVYDDEDDAVAAFTPTGASDAGAEAGG